MRLSVGILGAILSLVITSCTSTNVTPLDRRTILISTGTAPACGRSGARRVAFEQAAAETIRRGFDSFIVLGTANSSQARVIGRTPVTGTFSGTGSRFGNTTFVNGTANVYGGSPIIARARESDIAIRMFRRGEAGSGNAIDARTQLGSDWEEKVKNKRLTCFG